ncbi:MAG: hypothetical protein KKA90_03485 [Nanoarchaeota archaeon]|nr:hypothetical protein [Nanoarchaeota archaeon]
MRDQKTLQILIAACTVIYFGIYLFTFPFGDYGDGSPSQVMMRIGPALGFVVLLLVGALTYLKQQRLLGSSLIFGAFAFLAQASKILETTGGQFLVLLFMIIVAGIPVLQLIRHGWTIGSGHKTDPLRKENMT